MRQARRVGLFLLVALVALGFQGRPAGPEVEAYCVEAMEIWTEIGRLNGDILITLVDFSAQNIGAYDAVTQLRETEAELDNVLQRLLGITPPDEACAEIHIILVKAGAGSSLAARLGHTGLDESDLDKMEAALAMQSLAMSINGEALFKLLELMS